MIITNEEALRVICTDLLPEDVGPIVDQLERELKHSGDIGLPGIGLAAPQIGIAKNIAIVRVKNHNINLVNCKIIEGYDKEIFEQEGCLSFPGRFEKTLRYQEIHVDGNLVEPYNFISTGLLAVVIQHEIDHWISKLLPDFALPKQKNKLRPNDLCSCNSGKKYKKCCGK